MLNFLAHLFPKIDRSTRQLRPTLRYRGSNQLSGYNRFVPCGRSQYRSGLIPHAFCYGAMVSLVVLTRAVVDTRRYEANHAQSGH
jgi:hypothetical protein